MTCSSRGKGVVAVASRRQTPIMKVLSLSLSLPASHSLLPAPSVACSSSSSPSSFSPPPCSSICGRFSRPYPCCAFILKRPLALRTTLVMLHGRRSDSHVVRMAPEEEKMTRRSPLDFPIEWERPKPSRRPDIFPQFSPMKTPLPPPMPADPPEEDEEEEEKKEEEEEDPEKEETDKPETK